MTPIIKSDDIVDFPAFFTDKDVIDMPCLQGFIRDEAGAESAEYTVLALIIFVLIIVMMIPVSDRLEWIWRGLLQILRALVDTSPAAPATGAPQ